MNETVLTRFIASHSHFSHFITARSNDKDPFITKMWKTHIISGIPLVRLNQPLKPDPDQVGKPARVKPERLIRDPEPGPAELDPVRPTEAERGAGVEDPEAPVKPDDQVIPLEQERGPHDPSPKRTQLTSAPQAHLTEGTVRIVWPLGGPSGPERTG